MRLGSFPTAGSAGWSTGHLPALLSHTPSSSPCPALACGQPAAATPPWHGPVLPQGPEGSHCGCDLCPIPGDWRGLLTAVLSSSFEVRESEIHQSLDQRMSILPRSSRTWWKETGAAYVLTAQPGPVPKATFWGVATCPPYNEHAESPHAPASLADRGGPVMLTNEMAVKVTE